MLPSFSIGPLIIQGSYVIWSISVACSYLWIVFLLRVKGIPKGTHLASEWVQSILVIVLVWKFSYILTHPIQALSNPMKILYLNGGSIGYGFGAMLSIWFYVRNTKRIGYSLGIAMNTYLSAMMLFWGMSQLWFTLGYTIIWTPIWLYSILILVSMSFVLSDIRQLDLLSRRGWWLLVGWLGYRVLTRTITPGDVHIWIGFACAIVLWFINDQLSKGRDGND